jgi:hypothetical protein
MKTKNKSKSAAAKALGKMLGKSKKGGSISMMARALGIVIEVRAKQEGKDQNFYRIEMLRGAQSIIEMWLLSKAKEKAGKNSK